MRIVDLPPDDCVGASAYLFGPWLEVWLLAGPSLAVRLRDGWIVQIGDGTLGTEKPSIGIKSPGVTMLLTTGKVRLAFRARRTVQQ